MFACQVCAPDHWLLASGQVLTLALNHSILYIPTPYLQEHRKTVPKGLSSSSPKSASQATFSHLGPKREGRRRIGAHKTVQIYSVIVPAGYRYSWYIIKDSSFDIFCKFQGQGRVGSTDWIGSRWEEWQGRQDSFLIGNLQLAGRKGNEEVGDVVALDALASRNLKHLCKEHARFSFFPLPF